MNRRHFITAFLTSSTFGAIGLGSIEGLRRIWKPKPKTVNTTVETIRRPHSQRPDIEKLLDAIMWVESKGDPRAIGDGGNAVGAYQIWKICVDDCNRIAELHGIRPRLWTYNDRYSPIYSRAMCFTYITHYGKGDPERMARCWNGGPNGWKKQATVKYWCKVKAELERARK